MLTKIGDLRVAVQAGTPMAATKEAGMVAGVRAMSVSRTLWFENILAEGIESIPLAGEVNRG